MAGNINHWSGSVQDNFICVFMEAFYFMLLNFPMLAGLGITYRPLSITLSALSQYHSWGTVTEKQKALWRISDNWALAPDFHSTKSSSNSQHTVTFHLCTPCAFNCFNVREVQRGWMCWLHPLLMEISLIHLSVTHHLSVVCHLLKLYMWVPKNYMLICWHE